MPEQSITSFDAIEIHTALGLDYDEIVFMPPNPERFFRYIDGKLTFIGTKEDAKKFAVLRGNIP